MRRVQAPVRAGRRVARIPRQRRPAAHAAGWPVSWRARREVEAAAARAAGPVAAVAGAVVLVAAFGVGFVGGWYAAPAILAAGLTVAEAVVP